MIPVIITNGQTMTHDLSKFLFRKNASVLMKMDSLNGQIQDQLAGKKGTYQKIREGFSNLIDVGFCDESKVRLGASFVTNRLNFEEIKNIWRFCRDRSIFPNMETMTPNGRAKNHPEWLLTGEEIQALKFKLLEIDESEYGFTWNPYTPLVGAGCRQLEYSLCITVEGYVRPCAAILVNHLNIRPHSKNGINLEQSLEDPFIKKARYAEKYLEGKCGTCIYKTNECIGCRGSAYVYGLLKGLDQFKAIVSEDPFCSKKVQ